jgi:hypothetical protein
MAMNTEGQSKRAFVRDFLRKNPAANRKAVEEVWREAGHEGPISSALVSNLRRELGLTGNLRGASRSVDGDGAAESPKARARASKPKKRRRRHVGKATDANAAPAAGRKRQPGGRDKALAEVEEGIDRLIFKLTVVGGFEGLEQELRKVRHLLYRSERA